MVSCYYNIGLTQSAKHNIGGNKHDAIDQIFDGDVFESKNRYWQLSLAYVFESDNCGIVFSNTKLKSDFYYCQKVCSKNIQ